MTSTIAVPAQRGPVQRGPMALAPYTGPLDFEGQRAMAEFWATAGPTVPPLYRGRPGDVFNAIQTGIAFDLHPSTVMHHFFYDAASGRGGMSASLMHGLLNRAGHTLEVVQSNATICRMKLTRCDGRPGGIVEWKLSEAVAAGIADGMFRNYAADSLWARCTSRACRRHAPEVVVGYAYSLEELGSVVPDPDDDQVETERPVSERVQEFLPRLEGAPHAEIVEAFKFATSKRGKGLDAEYAGVFDGEERTVGEVLQRWGLEASERERLARVAERAERVDQAAAVVVAGRQAAAAATSEPATADAGPDADPDAELDAELDAEAVMPCGCDRAEYLRAGWHYSENCSERAATSTNTAEPASGPVGEVETDAAAPAGGEGPE
jgi:hypothetical protein